MPFGWLDQLFVARFDLTYEGLKFWTEREHVRRRQCFDLTYEGLKLILFILRNDLTNCFDLTYEGLKYNNE